MRLENTEKMTQCQLARYQLEGRIFGREDIYLYLYGPRGHGIFYDTGIPSRPAFSATSRNSATYENGPIETF